MLPIRFAARSDSNFLDRKFVRSKSGSKRRAGSAASTGANFNRAILVCATTQPKESEYLAQRRKGAKEIALSFRPREKSLLDPSHFARDDRSSPVTSRLGELARAESLFLDSVALRRARSL